MPLYEYTCHDCQSEFELLIRGSDQPQCPDCEGLNLERVLSVPAAHAAGNSGLPISRPMSSGGCGLPQCGQGGCMME